MKWLIVNGDDFGASRGVNRGILIAHASGILTSASLMVNRPASEAAARSARSAPDLSLGLHLELDAEHPDRTPDLVQQQLARFVSLTGRTPTHVDSHHDTHRHPGILPYVLEWADGAGVPVRGHSPAQHLAGFYGAWGGRSHPERLTVQALIELIDTEVGDGVTELSCHPGIVESDVETSYRTERELELRTLCRPDLRSALRERDIQLAGFRDLRAIAAHDAAIGEIR